MRARYYIRPERKVMCSALIRRAEAGIFGANAIVLGEREFKQFSILLPRKKASQWRLITMANHASRLRVFPRLRFAEQGARANDHGCT